MGTVRTGLGFLSWVGAILIVVGLILKVVWFDVASVGHNGMAPTLVRGERVLINRRASPSLGSIAVCQHPSEEGFVVGRVAATEGMTINSFGQELRLNAEPIRFERRGETSFHNGDNQRTYSLVWGTEYLGEGSHSVFREDRGRQRVKKTEVTTGKLYLLGDFRPYMGQDSRAYGMVDAASCRGTIVFRISPVEGLEDELAHGYFEPIR